MWASVSLEKAAQYEKYRLPYAPAAVDDLLARTGAVEVVADIGAGTGQLARLFADHCRRVYAVEPDVSMRQIAAHTLGTHPAVCLVDGTAEQTTLAPDSVDLIVIGNAFHRFKPEACSELHRILKHPGWVAVFSYSFTDKSFTEMLFSELATLSRLVERTERSWPQVPVAHLFGDCQVHTCSYPQTVAEDWQTFFGAACAGVEAPERDDRDFSRFEEINRAVFTAFAADGQIRVEYETTVALGRPKAREQPVAGSEDLDMCI